MFHIQTLVLGYFAFRLHAYKGRDVTHLMDDPIVGDDASAAAARTVGLPFLRGGIVEHGGSGHPIMEAIYTPRAPSTVRAWPSRRNATRWPPSRCRGRIFRN